jgi:hypothetical protein
MVLCGSQAPLHSAQRCEYLALSPGENLCEGAVVFPPTLSGVDSRSAPHCAS